MKQKSLKQSTDTGNVAILVEDKNLTNKLYISNHYGDGDNPIEIIYYRAENYDTYPVTWDLSFNQRIGIPDNTEEATVAEWLNADNTHQILVQTPKANDYSIDDTVIYVPEEVNVVSEDELVDWIFNGAE